MYETASGDTWDTIALYVYGDEKYAGVLMRNNPFLLGTVIFNAGTMVYTPKLSEVQDSGQSEDLPDWRD